MITSSSQAALNTSGNIDLYIEKLTSETVRSIDWDKQPEFITLFQYCGAVFEIGKTIRDDSSCLLLTLDSICFRHGCET